MFRLCGVIITSVFMLLFAMAACVSIAHSREGWQERPRVCDPKELTPAELTKCQDWIGKVERPDEEGTCCGEADAFLADEFKVGPDGEYIAVITRDYPGGLSDDGEGGSIKYPGTPRGTEITIPKEKVNRAYRDGNPTGHGIVFLRGNGQVLCYFSPTLAARNTGVKFAEGR